MSQKRWKLVLTELGRAVTLQETVVEASDWVTALTRARAQIGEKGGVPPGASCAIAPDGTATLVDAVARRRYTLSPTTDPLPVAPAPAPPAPAAAAAAAAAPVAAAPKGKGKVSKATMAYMVSPVASATPPVSVAVGTPAAAPASVAPTPAPSPEKPVVSVPRPSDRPAAAQTPAKQNKTVSYSTAEVREAAELIAKSSPPVAAAPAAAPAPVVAAPAPAPVVAAPAAVAASPASKKKMARQTMAYIPDDVAKAIANQAGVVVGAAAPAAPAPAAPAPAPVAPAPAAAAPVAAPVAPAAPDPLSAQLAAVAPALQPSTPPAAAPVAAAPAARPSDAPDGTELLHSRDAEPTKESPLIYRERHYLIPAGLDADAAEMILRRKFASLREELANRPKGKLVKMALFDHRFSGQPLRPPVLALQWKDWRGEPELIAPGRSMPASSIAPPSTPSMQPSVSLSPASPAPSPSVSPAPSTSPSPSAPPRSVPPPTVDSVIVDPAAYTAPSPSRPPPPAEPSVVIDSSAYAPAARPAPIPAPAPQQAAAAPAAGSSRRSRKPTPGAALTDDRLADAFEGLQDLFFLSSAFEGVEFVVRIVNELIPSEAISVALYDINTNELRFVSTTGAGAEERKGDAIPISAGLLGAAVADWTRCLVVSDVSSDARFDPGIDGRVGMDVTNMLIMPVAAQARLLALMQLSNRVGDLEYSQSDVNLIQYIGGRLGEFLLQTKMSADRPSKRAPAAR